MAAVTVEPQLVTLKLRNGAQMVSE